MMKELQLNKIDYAVSAAKSLVSIIPFAGGLFAEIIGNTIPNQRTDRIVKFIEILDKKLADLDQEMIAQKMKLEEYIDLFEDSIWAATRALTDERKEQIACLFKNCISDEEVNVINHKKLLSILSELDNVDLIFIKYYVLKSWTNKEAYDYFNENYNVLQEPIVTLRADGTQRNSNEYYVNHKRFLLRLGLIQIKEDKQAQNYIAHNDLKNIESTWLSILLLKEIDWLSHDFPKIYFKKD